MYEIITQNDQTQAAKLQTAFRFINRALSAINTTKTGGLQNANSSLIIRNTINAERYLLGRMIQ